MKSYKAEELFDKNGRLKPELAELAPKGNRRMGANPHANGGILLRDLCMPDFRDARHNRPVARRCRRARHADSRQILARRRKKLTNINITFASSGPTKPFQIY